jgi:hypothetical protein
MGKPEGKRPLGRPRRRWVDNVRMDLREVGCGDVDWIGLAQDRDRWRALVNSVLNLRVPYNVGKLSSVHFHRYMKTFFRVFEYRKGAARRGGHGGPH